MTNQKDRDLDKISRNILQGHAKIYSDIRKHPIVGMIRPLSHFEAWVWLLLELQSEDKIRSFKIGKSDRSINCPAGTVTHSLRFFAKAWGWSHQKVMRYLRMLQDHEQVKISNVRGFTQIYITNWQRYWSSEITVPEFYKNGSTDNKNYKNDYKKVEQRRTTIRTAEVAENNNSYEKECYSDEPQNVPNSIYNTLSSNNTSTSNKEKVKLTKEEKRALLDQRAKLFWQELDLFKTKYKSDLILEFWYYWTEPNRSLSKIKFEMEKTWDLNRRLIAWKSREDKWYGKKDKPTVAEIRQEARDRLKRVFGVDDPVEE